MVYSLRPAIIEVLNTLICDDFVIKANGSSMFPSIVKGDLIHCQREVADLKVGDIVLGEQQGGGLVIHRVIELGDSIKTRGDHRCQEIETLVKLFGKVEHIEKTPVSTLRRVKLYVEQFGKKVFKIQ